MKKGILDIFRSDDTVFSFKDIALVLRETDRAKLQAKINYHVRTGDLYRIRKGFYAKDKAYRPFELAAKMYTPSYISLETVLAAEGVVFQFDATIHSVSYLSREVRAGGRTYAYKKIKSNVLADTTGVEARDGCSIATKERAFLDRLYLSGDYHFDNLNSIDWKKCAALVKIYGNKALEKRFEKYRREYA